MQDYQSKTLLTFHTVIVKIILPPIYGSTNRRNKGEIYTKILLADLRRKFRWIRYLHS